MNGCAVPGIRRTQGKGGLFNCLGMDIMAQAVEVHFTLPWTQAKTQFASVSKIRLVSEVGRGSFQEIHKSVRDPTSAYRKPRHLHGAEKPTVGEASI